ncbi:hypothetical protein O181_046795 [Austropuccinia psidii MF-1]|uniref:Uncharacterized protein n=1 Tax=Austropuccinia psidii MF-1 TaxID=1389203 RepID=A0A9Q3DU49_9BASI|nr:hypothetical protein [Austropuccinia psidii MF-1]
MLIGIEDGHKSFFLFEPKSKNIYITHDYLFLDSEDFWPKFSSYCTSSSKVIEPPSIQLNTVSSSKTTSPLVIAHDKVDAINPHNFSDPADSPAAEVSPNGCPLAVEKLPPEEVICLPEQHNSPSPNLPKGWTYELVPNAGSLSSKNIVMRKQQTQPPSCFIGAVRSSSPQYYKEAINYPKSNACIFSIQKEFASLERHGVLEEVTKKMTFDYSAPPGCLERRQILTVTSLRKRHAYVFVACSKPKV